MAADLPSSTHGMGAASVIVRDSVDADFPTIQTIYAQAVLHGLGSFEESPPTLGELLKRRAEVVKFGIPYLTAELGGQVAGYSYASPFRPRAAYRYTLENSVYVAEGMQGNGIGQALLSALIARCEAGPWRQMIAVIGDSDNTGSIALHRKLGFRHVGTLDATGFKFGHWVDTVLMQRALGPGCETPGVG
jgi:L-amino acid N-acyltransferase YncA